MKEMQLGGSKFLTEQDTIPILADMLTLGKEARLAVAYWGTGACEKLGIKKGSCSVRILCDLFSGACNPKEIKRLLAVGAQ